MKDGRNADTLVQVINLVEKPVLLIRAKGAKELGQYRSVSKATTDAESNVRGAVVATSKLIATVLPKKSIELSADAKRKSLVNQLTRTVSAMKKAGFTRKQIVALIG